MMTLVPTLGDESPLCPLDHGPASSTAHAQHTRTLDAFYSKVPKDENGEMTGAAGEAYYEAAYAGRRMRLFIHYAQAGAGFRTPITTCYWQCPTCYFVLPATVTEPG